MRVLIKVKKHPTQRYLIHLFTQELVKEVRRLINSKKHAEAVDMVCREGLFEQSVPEHDAHNIKADLILSENGASWDLTK